jgi:aryl-alcohol dehydrogenase
MESVVKITAAVTATKGARWIMEEFELDDPRADEVLVRIIATGMCQTDLHVRDQHYPVPLPLVLGHEGAGIVERVGGAVLKVQAGDHVVLTFPSCGHCENCAGGAPSYCFHAYEASFGGSRLDGSSTLRRHGTQAHVHAAFFQQSSFATYALAGERNVVKVRKDAPLELLGPLGCGIQTGAGAVINTLRPSAGSSIAVFGTGAVGISALMAAKVVGCTTIIAIDVNEERLALARELGATHVINSKHADTGGALKGLVAAGLDYSLDTTGRPELLRVAVEALKPLGVCGLIGGAPAGTDLSLDMTNLLFGRTVRGIVQGDSVPDIFIPKLVDLFMAGRFPFDRLVRFYGFDSINDAAEDTRSGVTIKPILRMSGGVAQIDAPRLEIR